MRTRFFEAWTRLMKIWFLEAWTRLKEERGFDPSAYMELVASRFPLWGAGEVIPGPSYCRFRFSEEGRSAFAFEVSLLNPPYASTLLPPEFPLHRVLQEGKEVVHVVPESLPEDYDSLRGRLLEILREEAASYYGEALSVEPFFRRRLEGSRDPWVQNVWEMILEIREWLRRGLGSSPGDLVLEAAGDSASGAIYLLESYPRSLGWWVSKKRGQWYFELQGLHFSFWEKFPS